MCTGAVRSPRPARRRAGGSRGRRSRSASCVVQLICQGTRSVVWKRMHSRTRSFSVMTPDGCLSPIPSLGFVDRGIMRRLCIEEPPGPLGYGRHALVRRYVQEPAGSRSCTIPYAGVRVHLKAVRTTAGRPCLRARYSAGGPPVAARLWCIVVPIFPTTSPRGRPIAFRRSGRFSRWGNTPLLGQTCR